MDNGLSVTTLFSTTVSTAGWAHRWFDLSAWAGQTIILTFNLHQTAGAPYAWAYLDEVTLGSAYPDLWVSKSSPEARPGEQAVYTIAYGNRGGAAASGVRITDTLPAGLTFVDASRPPDTPAPALVWEVGDLPARARPERRPEPVEGPAEGSSSFRVVVTATVASTVTWGSTLTNTVAIAAVSPELETFNNTAQAAAFIGYRVYLPVVTRAYYENIPLLRKRGLY